LFTVGVTASFELFDMRPTHERPLRKKVKRCSKVEPCNIPKLRHHLDLFPTNHGTSKTSGAFK
jgi:hypothetical protein